MAPARLFPTQPPSASKSLPGKPDELRRAFAALKQRRDVARLLDVPYFQFEWLLRRSPPQHRYDRMQVKKRRGDSRSARAGDSLHIMQQKLLQVLSEVYQPRACVHGFVRNRSIVSNAARHVGRTWVLNVDLKDFFPTIHFGRVRGMFMRPPYRVPEEAATALAQVCCHANQLPQGAPTSPLVANMVCARLDGDLLSLAKAHRVTYTRFADESDVLNEPSLLSHFLRV